MDKDTPEINIEKIENENIPEADVTPPKSRKERKKERKEQKRERKRERKARRKGGGLIMNGLGKLTDVIYRALGGGLFGFIFTSYSAEEKALNNGYIKGRVFGNNRIKGYWRKIRGAFAQGFENSIFSNLLKKICNALLATSLKNYGAYLVSFAFFMLFSFFVRELVPVFTPAGIDIPMWGVAFIAVAAPLLVSKRTLAGALGSSISARAVLSDVFGMRDESFDVPPRKSKIAADLWIVFGILSGLLTLMVHPIDIVRAMILFVGMALILVTPEIGVIVSLFLLPFMSFTSTPSVYTAFIVLVSALGFLVKLIRGKRILRFEIIDLAVVAFFLVTLLSGVISVGGTPSLYEALMACMMMIVYFLVTNMMRTREWINRCVLALVSSATVTSIIGVLEYLFGDLSTEWLDTAYFGDIRGRVVSLFDNSNVLAFYLVMIFPFAIDLVSRSRNKSERFLARFSVLSIILCVIFTWSRGAWLGLIAAAILYMLIKTRKVIKAFFAVCLALPILSIVVPTSIINRFMSIGDLSDSSTYYRVLTWRGSLNAIIENPFVGYGYGTPAFERAYPSYAYAGIEAAEHTHSLYLQILFGMGIIGLAVFFIVILFFAQKNLEFFSKNDLGGHNNSAVAAFVSFIAALVMGSFDYIWYNNRILFLFFAVMGIAMAVIRINEDLEKRKRVDESFDSKSACIDIN